MDTLLTDPLGRTVVLRDRTWYGHILRGHPEMRPFRALVEEAVPAPVEIRVSNSDRDCRLYSRGGPRPGVMILVVADVIRGFVKTAHMTRRLQEGGIEWQSPTP